METATIGRFRSAPPGELLRSTRPTHRTRLHRILLDIRDRPREFALAPNPMVKVFPLPESIASPPQHPVRARALTVQWPAWSALGERASYTWVTNTVALSGT